MSSRFHSKWHRKNHHTEYDASYPDAGHDPIASPEYPFKGTFVIDTTGISLSANGSIVSDTAQIGSLSADNFSFNNINLNSAQIINLTADYAQIQDGTVNSLNAKYLSGDTVSLFFIKNSVTVEDAVSANQFYANGQEGYKFYNGSSISSPYTNHIVISDNLTVRDSISAPNISADYLKVNRLDITDIEIQGYTVSGDLVVSDNLIVNDSISFNSNLIFDSSSTTFNSTQLTGLSGNYEEGIYIGDTKLSQNNTRLSNIGKNFKRIYTDSNRNWWFCDISATGKYQIACALNSPNIYTSNDYGKTWISRGAGDRNKVSVAMSRDGKHQYAAEHVQASKIWCSHDYGETWSDTFLTTYQYISFNIVTSSTGKYVATGTYDSSNPSERGLFLSEDYGATFTKVNDINMSAIAISSDGKHITAQKQGTSANIIQSNDYGKTWSTNTNIQSMTNADWYGVAMSSNGQYQAMVEYRAIDQGGNIHISSDYGATWQSVMPGGWTNINMSSDGRIQIASKTVSSNTTELYVSYDHGNTWTLSSASGEFGNGILEVAMTDDAKYVLLTVYQDGIYLSKADESIDANLTVTESITSPSISADYINANYINANKIDIIDTVSVSISSPSINTDNLTASTSISSPNISADDLNVLNTLKLGTSNLNSIEPLPIVTFSSLHVNNGSGISAIDIIPITDTYNTAFYNLKIQAIQPIIGETLLGNGYLGLQSSGIRAVQVIIAWDDVWVNETEAEPRLTFSEVGTVDVGSTSEVQLTAYRTGSDVYLSSIISNNSTWKIAGSKQLL